jgi:hypothetical protein
MVWGQGYEGFVSNSGCVGFWSSRLRKERLVSNNWHGQFQTKGSETNNWLAIIGFALFGARMGNPDLSLVIMVGENIFHSQVNTHTNDGLAITCREFSNRKIGGWRIGQKCRIWNSWSHKSGPRYVSNNMLGFFQSKGWGIKNQAEMSGFWIVSGWIETQTPECSNTYGDTNSSIIGQNTHSLAITHWNVCPHRSEPRYVSNNMSGIF